ncbi:DUF4259 domain-containing protein [Actinoplanes palleronii]|uniref:TetR family transcriptional regulator n=1 Tax=Actinoplanes palleronii TaxID=113570 RepID=A0ABQ4BP72_9ACTN|nr:DUF4259 domain-containing protein [Actinoplanes palleronii]GIE72474.1 hypothetical protein Apa02nite_085820 [Actinoplanes palleronii]
MGTFGTGPFSSDGAMDFLEELAERPPEGRVPALTRMFLFVRDKPELLGREYFPDEVVAAAAIVAATLPGGEQFDERLATLADQELAPEVRLAAPAPDLAPLALAALKVVAGPWHQGWTNPTDATEARATIATLSQVLTSGSVDPEGSPR